MLQVEVSAYHLNEELVNWCQKNDIVVSAFAPFGNPARFWRKPGDTNLLEEEIALKIAQNHGKTSAQVAMYFYMLIHHLFLLLRSFQRIQMMSFRYQKLIIITYAK